LLVLFFFASAITHAVAPPILPPAGGQAMLHFGHGPKAALKCLVIVNDNEIRFDANGDGKFTASEICKLREWKKIELADPDGKTRYLINSISPYKEKTTTRVMANVEIKGSLAYRQYCDLGMVGDRQKPFVAHFHGPLAAYPRTMNWELPAAVNIKKGETPSDVYLVVGTMDADRGCWVVVNSHIGDKCQFGDLRPEVEIEFPVKTVGEVPLKKRYTLEKFC
jgi:hypothetical protein